MPQLLITPQRLEVHGHRGCRGLRPENTLSAFLHALSLGVDVLEMDVVISADHEVVVSHEPWFNPHICRFPDGQALTVAAQSNLYQMSYADIRRYDCGQLQHPSFPSQLAQPACKPLLREVLATIQAAAAIQPNRPPIKFSVEIKSSPEGDNLYHPIPSVFLPLVFAELNAAGVLSRTTLLCFDERILQLAYQQYPSVATCLLVEANQAWMSSLHQLGFVPTALGPDFSTVTPTVVQQLRTAFPGLRLVPWTVNNLDDMQRISALGVDGITTDYPDRLITWLATNPA